MAFKNWVMFGHSHFFGDIYDTITNSGDRLSKVVVNMPEKITPGRPTLEERIKRLPYRVDILPIDQFQPGQNESYVIGFSRKQIQPVVDDLKARFNLSFHPLIHGQSIVQCGALFSEGVIVDAGVVLGPWCRIQKHVIISRGVIVGHDCGVGGYSFLGAGAVLCGHARIGVDVFVGANATVIPDMSVGDGAFIAAGAVVTRDVPSNTMVAGVPAEVKKQLN